MTQHIFNDTYQINNDEKYKLNEKKIEFNLLENKYYEFDYLDQFPHTKLTECSNIYEVWEWCELTCGNDWIWSGGKDSSFARFWFKHNEHLVMFKLKFNCND